MKLTIVVVSWNTREDLARCLGSIFRYPPAGVFEVRVVDNGSSDGSAEAVIERFAPVRLYRSEVNLGYARATNLAAAEAQCDFLLLLNPDTLVHPGAINRLLDYLAERPEVGAVGPMLLNPDGSVQVSAYPEPTLVREWWRMFHLDSVFPVSRYRRQLFASSRPQPVETLMGACLLLRQRMIDQVGLLDESYFMYSEEIDLCVRIRRAGWAIHWLPQAVVTHLGGRSARQAADQMFLELYRNKVRFFRKWHSGLEVALYKNVLWQAAWLRYILAQAAQSWPDGGYDRRKSKAAQYKMLLAQLSSF